MRKWIACILTVLLAVSVLAGCGKTEETAKKDKVKVAVSFDAMGEFVKAVGKDKVSAYRYSGRDGTARLRTFNGNDEGSFGGGCIRV